MKPTQTLLATFAISVGLMAMSTEAGATQLGNYATYSVILSRVQAPQTGQVYVPGATGTQASYSNAPYLSSPVPVQVAGSADTGTNADGYGYASGHGYARAEAGVLRAAAYAEGQSVAKPGTNVGASAAVDAVARFTDMAVFTPVAGQNPWQNLLIVSGNLLLTGDMIYQSYQAGSFGEVRVGGTGVNPQSANAQWTGDTTGRQKSAFGVYSPWVPGSTISIPYSFAVYGGQQTELSYWLDAYASAGSSFLKCPSDLYGGSLCNVGQVGSASTNVDYSHTLTWGGVHVTDWFGAPVNFSVSSQSGFDYAVAYSPHVAAVPEPETYTILLAGLGLLGVMTRRKKDLDV